MYTRRKFIKDASIAGSVVSLSPTLAMSQFSSSQRAKDKLKIGLIGVGLRGINHLDNLLKRDDVTVTAICDIALDRVDFALDKISKTDSSKPAIYTGSDYAYLSLLESDIDGVIISTPWLWHARMAKDAMEKGVYAGVEVSAANTLEECWDLVNAHEASGTHLMILENVNYRRDVMAVLNMVKQDVFGELSHFRCGYQHDLRHVKFNDGKQPYGGGVEFGDKGMSEARWRTQHSLKRNADVYPTHGLGPVAVMADINRGNRMVSLSSHSTKARGLHDYIVNHPKGGEDHPNASLIWQQGDVITTTINTANGETIIVTHDCNLPRPYSLGFRVQGLRGITEFDYHTQRIFVEGKSEGHRWEAMDSWLEKYDHPLWQKYGEYAEGAGHGGMDFFVLNAFVESIKANVAPPLDVYDAAAWSAVTPLSESSLLNNGAPQEFPDFTRGTWINRAPWAWMEKGY